MRSDGIVSKISLALWTIASADGFDKEGDNVRFEKFIVSSSFMLDCICIFFLGVMMSLP